MRNLFSLFLILLMVILPSCEEASINEDKIDAGNLPKTKTRDVTDDTIDGGSLPEVTITAVYIAHEGGGGDGGWWHPPFTEIPNPPSGSGVGGGGGSGRPNPPLPTVTLAKDLVTLFPNGSNLSKVDLEKLNSEFKRMMVHCEYEALNKLLRDKNFSGGKIVLLPEDVMGLLAVNWPKGDLNIIGSDAIDATNLAHEWVHLAQGAIDAGKCKYETIKYEGMMEFELVVFQDIVHYAKHGTIKHLQPETDFPTGQQWIENLMVERSYKDGIYKLYNAWIKATFIDNGKIVLMSPDKIAGTVALYNYFMQQFFLYSRNYANKEFKREGDYGFTTLSTLINAVRTNCFQ